MCDPVRDALRAEWTKLRTLPETLYLGVGTVVLTVGISAFAAYSSCSRARCDIDPVAMSLTGVAFGQAAVSVFAVQLMGLLSLTFVAVPRRLTVLGAKAILASALITLVGVVSVAGSYVAGRLLLPVPVPFAVRPLLGSVLYLVLIGLLSLGTAAAVREASAAVGVVLGLLYVLPIVALTLSDPDWQRHLRQISPMTAGLAIQATRNLSDLPIRPWAGLGVLALWSLGSLVIGGGVLKCRNAPLGSTP